MDFFSSNHLDGEALCQHLDDNDELSSVANSFHFPSSHDNKKAIYLCGNSLGLQPKAAKEHVLEHMDKWASMGVEGHFTEPEPWLTIDDVVQESMARLVGALPDEVVMMNSLTCNLHLMMNAFYHPTVSRHKILIEKKAFPSDYHAAISQILHHKYSPKTSLVEIEPREGEVILHHEDIERAIDLEGDSIALVLFSGVQYYTGQLFNMERITRAARARGCIVGFDLAHAVGNVPLQLHEWGCDFACWCSYKYLNCGPGSIGGCFVHDRHGSRQLIMSTESSSDTPIEAAGDDPACASDGRLAGWWGHRLSDRFDMSPTFVSCRGAYGYRLSNPPVLLVACAKASLDLFDKIGIDKIRRKSELLTGYLEHLIKKDLNNFISIFTPSTPQERGCQLSLAFKNTDLEEVFAFLQQHGVVCDIRKPDVMRIAPVPLYNSFRDVYTFVEILKKRLTT